MASGVEDILDEEDMVGRLPWERQAYWLQEAGTNAIAIDNFKLPTTSPLNMNAFETSSPLIQFGEYLWSR